MANITGKLVVNVSRGKPTQIVLFAPAGFNFKNTTRVESVKDQRDPDLFFDVRNWTPYHNFTRLRIKIQGRGYPSVLAAGNVSGTSKIKTTDRRILVDPPDSGMLVITISDPTNPPPPVDPLPVIYVDDPTP
jgi:hypothetical protein